LFALTNNTISLTAQPQSIYHFVFQTTASADVAASYTPQRNLLECVNGFSGNPARINYNVTGLASIRIFDIEGRTVKYFDGLHDSGILDFNGVSGIYEVVLNDGTNTQNNKILIVN
jgi:hypothetical protein